MGSCKLHLLLTLKQTASVFNNILSLHQNPNVFAVYTVGLCSNTKLLHRLLTSELLFAVKLIILYPGKVGRGGGGGGISDSR